MQIIRVPDTSNEVAAKTAAHVIRQGGIVLYPTDTIYGLAVNAMDANAIARLRALKGRERKKPISIVVPSVKDIQNYATLTPCAKKLAEAHFPGPLTLVIPAGPKVPKDLQLNGTIGVRIPNDPFCLALTHAFGNPFTSTSANLAGRETLWDVLQVLHQFGDAAEQIDLVIDAGERRAAFGSTVVLATGDAPVILRQGMLSPAELGIEVNPLQRR